MYTMPYRTHIHLLDYDSLLQIFSCYRLEDRDNWHLRHTWWRLAHVCRRWRYLIYHSPSHLDVCLRLTNGSPSMATLSHLPPLPLVIDYSDRTGILTRKNEDNIDLGLQQHGRVRWVALQAPSSRLRMWLEPMNKLFPRLRGLSLLSTTTGEMSLALPETFQAPDLHHLSLHGIGLPKGLALLASMITLSILTLTNIRDSCYFPPGQLVTQLKGLPYLEELSIGFAIPIPLPSSEGVLLPAPVSPVTLATLRQLTFRGLGVYLDNLVAQINTPLLEQLNLILFFEIAFTLVNLTEFIHRTEGFRPPAAQVIFNKNSASIDGYHEQWGVRKFAVHINCEHLDWQIDSVTQFCSALGKVLSSVEELKLDLNVDGISLGWENTLDNILWHELLLPFIGVKKLHIGFSLACELSRALESVSGGLVMELLPELQQLEINHTNNAFSGFVKTRESIGRPVHLLVLPVVRPLSPIVNTC